MKVEGSDVRDRVGLGEMLRRKIINFFEFGFELRKGLQESGYVYVCRD